MSDQKLKVALNTRIDPDLKEALQAFCASKQPPVTMSAMVEWLIRRELEANQPTQPTDALIRASTPPQQQKSPD